MFLFKKMLFKGLYIAAKLIPDFSICIAINSKLLKCPEIKTTGFSFFFIFSKLSIPSIEIYLDRLYF